jgi:dihydroneopterin aldolase
MADNEIQIHGLRVVGTHGALAEEQVRAQPFEVDVELSIDLSRAGVSDNLDDTVDYGGAAVLVERIVREERYVLLERLATRLADALLAGDERITGATVTVRKLRPPVPVDLQYAAVRVTRRR